VKTTLNTIKDSSCINPDRRIFIEPKTIVVKSLSHLFFIAVLLIGCKSKESLQVDVAGVRPEIESIAKEIEKDNFIGTDQIGRMPGTSQAFARRQELMDKASNEELVQLTDDTNPAVSLTALEGLYKRSSEQIPAIMAKYAERDDFIHYIKGDISKQMPSLEYAYTYILHKPMPGESLPDELDEPYSRFQLPESLEATIIEKIIELREQK